MKTFIYIDDSDTLGIKSKSYFDSLDTKSWFSIILTEEEKKDAEKEMLECIKKLKKDFNASEFHFKDIYQGKKEFKNISFAERMNIFYFFAEVHDLLQFPILMQSFGSDDYEKNKISVDSKSEIDGFFLNRPSDLSLYFLLIRIKKFLNNSIDYEYPFQIIIDEGKQKKIPQEKSNYLAINY